MINKVQEENKLIEEMFNVGAHYAYSRSKRHPSMKSSIYGIKSNVEIIDLEETARMLSAAEDFVMSLAKEGKKLLLVGSKNEARDIIEREAKRIGASYIKNRWIGGTLTNFEEIKKRIKRLQELTEKKEKGDLGMYTKKEQLMISREIGDLEKNFGGLLPMADSLPKALFVIDPKKEFIAIDEARSIGIPVVTLANSDCDISKIEHPIAANDSALASIDFFTTRIVDAYKRGQGQKEKEIKESPTPVAQTENK